MLSQTPPLRAKIILSWPGDFSRGNGNRVTSSSSAGYVSRKGRKDVCVRRVDDDLEMTLKFVTC